MRSTLGQRLRVLLLATFYVAGNFGLPATDLLLNHGVGAPRDTTQAHIETTGGCGQHADHCVLARVLGDLRLQAPGAIPYHVAARLPAFGDPLAADRVVPLVHFPPHHSRAPPARG